MMETWERGNKGWLDMMNSFEKYRWTENEGFSLLYRFRGRVTILLFGGGGVVNTWRYWFSVFFFSKSNLLYAQNKLEIVFITIYFNIGAYFYLHLPKKLYISHFHVRCVISCECMTSSPHYEYSRNGQEVFFSKMWETQKFITS